MRRLTTFLACRTLGHAWHVVPADRPGSLGGDPLWLSCERCGTQRHDSISRSTGDLINRQYHYADGYQHAFDALFSDEAPTRSDFRRMLLEAHLVRQRGDRQARQEKEGRDDRRAV